MKRYKVEWSYINKLGDCYTEHKTFLNGSEQQEFAFKKFHEENVYEVRKIVEEVWKKN